MGVYGGEGQAEWGLWCELECGWWVGYIMDGHKIVVAMGAGILFSDE